MVKLFKPLKKAYRVTLGRRSLSVMLSKELKPGWSVLDVGCGKCSALYGIRDRHKIYSTGLDFYVPYIEESKTLKIHDNYVHGNIKNLASLFELDSFDCVISTEVIEHLSKSEGLKMLEEIERIARKKVILTTPNGFLPTYAGPKDNPTESHISGWTTEELKKLGFEVYGLNGFRKLWGIHEGLATPKLSRPRCLYRLTDISNMITYYYPSAAFQLFFVKHL